jgi:hypothetical protein
VAQLAALLIGAGGNVSVRSAEGAAAQTELDRERRLLQSILDTLAQAQPRALRLDELKAALATSLENGAPDGEHVAQLVLRAALNGVVQLHAIAPPLVTEAGDRPVASAVARSQNADSDLLTNLMHEVVRVDDPLARRLLALLDGTRGRAQLLVELGAELGDGADARAAQLDSHLHRLGRLGLLSA